MSKETFNRLMGELSSEAVQERLDEERAARRHKIFCGIGRACSWVVLALGLAAGYVYRDEIGRASQQLMSRSEPPGVEQQAKTRQVLKQAQQHADTVEEAGK